MPMYGSYCPAGVREGTNKQMSLLDKDGEREGEREIRTFAHLVVECSLLYMCVFKTE